MEAVKVSVSHVLIWKAQLFYKHCRTPRVAFCSVLQSYGDDDTLASFRRLFLVPVNWYQKLVSLSYFSGARNWRWIEHVQFWVENWLES